MTLEEFKGAIQVLKLHSIGIVEENLLNLSDQKDALVFEKEDLSVDLRTTKQNSLKIIQRAQDRTEEITVGPLQDLKTLFKRQQKNNVSAEAKAITIGKIATLKEELDRLEMTRKDSELRVQEKGKAMLFVMNEIERIEKEIASMTRCREVYGFFEGEGVSLETVADYEYEKYYYVFARG